MRFILATLAVAALVAAPANGAWTLGGRGAEGGARAHHCSGLPGTCLGCTRRPSRAPTRPRASPPLVSTRLGRVQCDVWLRAMWEAGEERRERDRLPTNKEGGVGLAVGDDRLAPAPSNWLATRLGWQPPMWAAWGGGVGRRGDGAGRRGEGAPAPLGQLAAPGPRERVRPIFFCRRAAGALGKNPIGLRVPETAAKDDRPAPVRVLCSSFLLPTHLPFHQPTPSPAPSSARASSPAPAAPCPARSSRTPPASPPPTAPPCAARRPTWAACRSRPTRAAPSCASLRPTGVRATPSPPPWPAPSWAAATPSPPSKAASSWPKRRAARRPRRGGRSWTRATAARGAP